MTKAKPDARAARAAKKKIAATKPTTGPTLPTTPEGWQRYAADTTAEHAARPPVQVAPRNRTAENWIALGEMIAREFGR